MGVEAWWNACLLRQTCGTTTPKAAGRKENMEEVIAQMEADRKMLQEELKATRADTRELIGEMRKDAEANSKKSGFSITLFPPGISWREGPLGKHSTEHSIEKDY